MGAHTEPAAGVRDAGKKKTRCATCSAQPRELPTAGVPVAGAGFFPTWENRSRGGYAPGMNRVCARLGKGTNTVRDLLTAGVPAAGVFFGKKRLTEFFFARIISFESRTYVLKFGIFFSCDVHFSKQEMANGEGEFP